MNSLLAIPRAVGPICLPCNVQLHLVRTTTDQQYHLLHCSSLPPGAVGEAKHKDRVRKTSRRQRMSVRLAAIFQMHRGCSSQSRSCSWCSHSGSLPIYLDGSHSYCHGIRQRTGPDGASQGYTLVERVRTAADNLDLVAFGRPSGGYVGSCAYL